MNETWDRLKVEIVVPQAATNLVTNPSVETNDTGYTLVGASVTKERVATYQRRGAYSLKITPVNGVESGVYFGDIAVTSGLQYSVSVDVHAPDGENFYLKVLNTSSTSRGSTTFSGIGYWKRESLTFTAAATESIRIYITRLDSETSTDPFYIDGLQLENNSEPTTYFDGDFVGFVPTRNDFGWNGTRHASTSYRTAKTKAGGSLVNLADYATIINVLGLGMGQFSQSYSDLNTGGALYEKHTRNTTPFSIILQFSGNNHGEMAAKRAAVINAVRPDNADDQPMIVRVTAIDDTVGYVAGQPVDIPCMLLPSLTDTPQLPSSQRTALQFRALDGVFPGAFNEGAQLDFADSLTNANYIVMKDSDGQWQELASGLNGTVYCVVEGPDGYIYIGGAFTNAGGDADADYLCKWDGTSFSSVVPGINGYVWSLAFDAEGNLYIGGQFTDLGDTNGDYIVMWDGSSLHSLGSGLNNRVYDMIFDTKGYLYLVGLFVNAGGDADADYLAVWNGTSFNAPFSPPNTGSASVVSVKTIAIDSDYNFYLGGEFTNLGDISNADNLAVWNGTAWGAVGDVSFAGAGPVEKVFVASNGLIYIGGQFSNVNGLSGTDNIVKWTGTAFEQMSGGLYLTAGGDGVWAIAEDENGLIWIGGQFSYAGDLYVQEGLVKWNGSTWIADNIDLGVGAQIRSIVLTGQNELIVGGSFSGAATANGITSVVNTGGADIYPVIRINGPGAVWGIINSFTGAQISFNGLTLLTGEILTINLEPDNLTVKSSFRGDCLNYIAPGSDLADFYLRPGTNNISLLMTGTDSDTNAVIYYSPKYWSIDQTKYGV